MSYLSLVEVVAIHDVLIEAFGGVHGIRDFGALESAVLRPRSGYHEDAVAEATALWESLILNHPFIDGNKRAAVACADIHLRINGLVMDADPDDAIALIDALIAANAMRIDRIEPWLRERVRQLGGDR